MTGTFNDQNTGEIQTDQVPLASKSMQHILCYIFQGLQICFLKLVLTTTFPEIHSKYTKKIARNRNVIMGSDTISLYVLNRLVGTDTEQAGSSKDGICLQLHGVHFLTYFL